MFTNDALQTHTFTLFYSTYFLLPQNGIFVPCCQNVTKKFFRRFFLTMILFQYWKQNIEFQRAALIIGEKGRVLLSQTTIQFEMSYIIFLIAFL